MSAMGGIGGPPSQAYPHQAVRSSSYDPYTNIEQNHKPNSSGGTKKNIVVQLNTQSIKGGDSKRTSLKSMSLRDDLPSDGGHGNPNESRELSSNQEERPPDTQRIEIVDVFIPSHTYHTSDEQGP
jgi:hypothetical protein